MLVTVMIPTYNQEEYIVQAIQSALAQTYLDLEVIVCDDNSTDDTFQKASKIKDKRLKVCKNEANLGRVGNYRKLLYELAHGEYVINLDGDDYFVDESYIARAVELIETHFLDMVFSNQIIKYTETEKQTSMRLPAVLDGNWLFMNYGTDGIHIPHMSALYLRGKALGLDFYSKDIISSDWESLLKFIISSQIGFLPECSGAWRQVENSQSKPKNIDVIFKNFMLIDSVYNYAQDHFRTEQLIAWKNRMDIAFLRNIPIQNIACNFRRIVMFSLERVSWWGFMKVLFNYRFLGKLIIGKMKYRCAA